VVTVDVDEHPELAAQFGIRAMPTVLAFRNGDQVSGFKGALPEGQLRKFLDDIPK
jgi:putative thioredoxin